MSATKLVLADNTEINLQSGAAIGCMKAHYVSKVAMAADWDKLTSANLKTVQVMADDVVVGNYVDMILENETSTLHKDGSVDTIWNIREKTENEKLKEEVAALKERQEIHDGAIADLGVVVSTIAEQQEVTE